MGCKKVVASGARTSVIMQEERCFGILNAEVYTPADYLGSPKQIEITSESVINEITTYQSNALTPQRAVLRRMQGQSAVGGDLAMELANNGMSWLMVQAIGKIQGAGVSSDPYTILPVDSAGVPSDSTAGYQQDSALYTSDEITYDDSASDCVGYESGYYEVDPFGMEPGFTLFIGRDPTTIGGLDGQPATNEIWFKYLGMKVNSWSISASSTEIATTTFSLLGREEEVVDIPKPSPITTRPAVNDPLAGFQGAVTLDDEEICVLSLELTVNNNLNADQYCMGDRNRNSLPEQRREITGTITTELSDLEFYNKYLNATSVKLIILFDLLSDGTETLKLILPQIEFDGTTPTSGGPEVINQELPFTAIWDSTASSLLTQPSYAPNGFDFAIEIVTAGTLV